MLFGIDGNDFGGCGTYINTNESCVSFVVRLDMIRLLYLLTFGIHLRILVWNQILLDAGQKREQDFFLIFREAF